MQVNDGKLTWWCRKELTKTNQQNWWQTKKEKTNLIHAGITKQELNL